MNGCVIGWRHGARDLDRSPVQIAESVLILVVATLIILYIYHVPRLALPARQHAYKIKLNF